MSEVTAMPKTEDKTPCETCGKMVTTHKGGRASHMRTHEKDAPKATEAVSPVAKPDKELSDEQKTIALAMEAEARRLEAPDIFLSEDTSDGNAALVAMYAPECIDKFTAEGKLVEKAKRHAFFSSRDNLRGWASKGYIPKLAENGSYVTNDGGDILTTCDVGASDARQARSQQESRDIVRSSDQDLSKMSVDGVDGSRASDLRNTSVKVTQEEIAV